MNGYKCFWKQQVCEIEAENSYRAQQAAEFIFQQNNRRKVKRSDITVVLCEKEGEQVTHQPLF